MVESTREINDESSLDRRYYISSLECDAEVFGKAVRNHWGIENSVHWVLDIAIRESESRIRSGVAPEEIAVIRHIALNLLLNNNVVVGGRLNYYQVNER